MRYVLLAAPLVLAAFSDSGAHGSDVGSTTGNTKLSTANTAASVCAAAHWQNNQNKRFSGGWLLRDCVRRGDNLTARVSVTGTGDICTSFHITEARLQKGNLEVTRASGCGGQWSGTVPGTASVTDPEFQSPFGVLTIEFTDHPKLPGGNFADL